MERQKLAEVALYPDLAVHERRQRHGRILVDQQPLHGEVVGAYGHLGVFEVPFVEVEGTGGRIHVRMHGRLAKRHVGDDEIHTKRRCRRRCRAQLVADLSSLGDPTVGQERIASHAREVTADRSVVFAQRPTAPRQRPATCPVATGRYDPGVTTDEQPASRTDQDPHPVREGAEAWSSSGTNGCGVLVLHGFTGNPISMRPLAEAFAAAGFFVEMPRLPGHGTAVEDMIPTRWPDWLSHALATYDDLAGRVDRVVVAGLSMGGTLTATIGLERPTTAGLVLINAALEPMAPEFRDLLRQMGEVSEVMPAIGDDIAKPGVTEGSYDATPIAALLSLAEAGDVLAPRLGELAMPCLLLNSPQDHVVPPSAAEFFVARVTTEVERVVLERSFHVATLDYDAGLIETTAVAFANRVCGLT